MKRPTYKMKEIALADCKPHADAEAYSASTEDRTALSNSINESGLLSPIAVIPDEEGKGWYVIDGIGRMNAMVESGEEVTVAQVFDLGDFSVAEFVVSKNSMMRKVTAGTRVMAYLKCHEREVLAAADPEQFRKRSSSKWRNRHTEAAVSYETAASQKGWSANAIAERIGVSKQDVLAGIELLKATAKGEDGSEDGEETYSQEDLFQTAEAVLRGETPIRRWKAAAGGKMSNTGGNAAADYTSIAGRIMVSLRGVFRNWQTVPMDCRKAILDSFSLALEDLPDDFRAAIEKKLCRGCAKGNGKKKV